MEEIKNVKKKNNNSLMLNLGLNRSVRKAFYIQNMFTFITDKIWSFLTKTQSLDRFHENRFLDELLL